jgi:hypothetical protein
MASPADVRRGDHRTNRVQPEYPYDFSYILDRGRRVVEHPAIRLPDQAAALSVGRHSRILDREPGDADVRSLAHRREEAELLTARIEWHPAGMRDPLIIHIPDFFDDGLG